MLLTGKYYMGVTVQYHNVSALSPDFKGKHSEEVTMDCYHHEPHLNDVLADPVIRLIMIADHVNPEALETSLRNVARKIAPHALAAERNP